MQGGCWLLPLTLPSMPSLPCPVIHRLHQGRVDPPPPSEQSFFFWVASYLELRFWNRLAFVIEPYLVLLPLARHCLKDWSENYQQQYSFWREEKAKIVLNNPFPQAAPLQAQPRGSNEEPDLAIGRPPGQAHWGGPHWPGKGDENMMILTMILTTKRITVMTTI